MNENNLSSGSGGLLVNVTTLKGLYPVKGAVVTVFSGDVNNMQVIDSRVTDQSGRTSVFVLSAPERSLSETAGASEKPYASYNVSVKADGYIEQINLNVPVFSGVLSLQSVDLLLLAAAGDNLNPRIYDGTVNYEL